MDNFFEFKNVDFINSMEAILGHNISLGNNIIMPFYNLLIMENSLTPAIGLNSGMYLDRCLVSCKDVSGIVWNYDSRDRSYSGKELCFGGELFTDLTNHQEFWITCESFTILIPSNFNKSTKSFLFDPKNDVDLEFLSLGDLSNVIEYLEKRSSS